MPSIEPEQPEQSPAELPRGLPFPPVTYSHILHCSYHYWHPLYRTLTPRARAIPLSAPFVSYLHADGIVLPPEDTPRTATDDDNDNLDSYSDDDAEEPPPDPSREWEDIHAQIKSTIAQFGGIVTPKLNWSAPKDATFMSATNDLQCRTPNDIYLLLKSSDFITHDLEYPFDGCVSDEEAAATATAATGTTTTTATTSTKPEVPYHLILRKFVNFNPALEFRCFVRNRVLLCICQRDQNHFDFLFSMRDTLRARIQSFFDDKLKHTFPDPNFAFDVYIPPPHERVWLIDINPWAETTDPLLFSWLEILNMQDPIGFTEDESDEEDQDPSHPPEEQFVRLSIRPENSTSNNVPTDTDIDAAAMRDLDGASGPESESESEEEEEVDGGNDETSPFLPEFRLIKRDDPEAYAFSTTQYSAHKLPREVVDASLAGPGGMQEFLGKWQDILAKNVQQDSDSDE